MVRALVTGGAGFIGSNLVARLVDEGYQVRVIDDLSTGHANNVVGEADLAVGDICDQGLMARLMNDIDVVFHEAAAGSVARSVTTPLVTDTVNVHGTLTVLKAALDAGTHRVVFASSSSVYGGAAELPAVETATVSPRSPYAVTKLAGEHYCRVFAQLWGLETVALRYFNVFGPNQRPDSAYAAVVPLFIAALTSGKPPVVHGDGIQTRDFTYVADVVEANLAAARAPADPISGQAFNIARGEQHSLLELLGLLEGIVGPGVAPVHSEPRAGDIRCSQADVAAARQALSFEARVPFADGLKQTVDWYRAVTPRT